MGVSSSKFAKGPSSFATPFDSQWDVSEEQARKWKSFDYVIVGGGESSSESVVLLDLNSRLRYQGLLAACSHHGCQQIPT